MKAFHPFKTLVGFLLLFVFYHAAEYGFLFLNSVTLFFTGMTAFFVATFLICKWQRSNLKEWGLGFVKNMGRQIATGFLLGFIFSAASFVCMLKLNIEIISSIPNFQTFITQTLFLATGTILTSLSEDILTRGYLYKHLHGKLNPVLFALISAFIFVLNHIYRLQDGNILLVHLFVMGILLVIPLIITKQLWMTTGIHFGINMVYHITNNVMHVENGSNDFPGMIILIIFMLLLIPVSAWFAIKSKENENKISQVEAYRI